ISVRLLFGHHTFSSEEEFMNTRTLWLGAVALHLALVAAPSGAAIVINGVNINERVVNNNPDSTLTTTKNYPTLVRFDEHFKSGGSAFNRHDALLSTDAGATARSFLHSDSFDVSADVTLADGSNSPRKEAGIRINTPSGDNGLF